MFVDPVASPYSPGAGTTPVALVGRDDELKRFSVLVERLASGRSSEGLVLTGPRGMGKTALLREFDRRAQAKDWFVASEELNRQGDFSTVIALLARKLLLSMSASRRFGDRVKRALGVLKAFSAVSPIGVKFELDFDLVSGTADSGNIRRDVAELFVEIGEVAGSGGAGVIFLLDELHTRAADGSLEILDAALHQVAQQRLPVTMVGGGLFPASWVADQDRSDLSRISTYATRMYRFLRLQPLSRENVMTALAKPAEELGVRFDADALAAAAQFAGGHPWFVQLVGEAAWEAATLENQITLADVQAATAVTQKRVYVEFFPQVLAGLDPLALTLLGRLADSGLFTVKDALTDDSIENLVSMSAFRELLERDLVRVVDSPFAGGELTPGDELEIAMPLLADYATARRG